MSLPYGLSAVARWTDDVRLRQLAGWGGFITLGILVFSDVLENAITVRLLAVGVQGASGEPFLYAPLAFLTHCKLLSMFTLIVFGALLALLCVIRRQGRQLV